MTVNEFIKNINDKKLNSKYMFVGGDDYLISILVKGITKALGIQNPDFNINKYIEAPWDFDKIYESIMVLPVFDSTKLTIIDMTQAKKKDIEHIERLNDNIEHIPNDSVVVVVVGANTIDGLDKSKFTVVDVTTVEDKFLINRINLIVSKSGGKKIDATASNLLIEYSNRDLGKITTEAKKLVAYVGDRDTIVVDDVKDTVVKTLDYEVYELTQALGKKDSSKVYILLNSMKERKDEYRGVLGLIYAYFRRLLHIALSKNKDIKQLASDLGVKEGAIRFSMNLVPMFGAMKLKNIVDLCMKYDYETKQTITTVENAIEVIVLTILNM